MQLRPDAEYPEAEVEGGVMCPEEGLSVRIPVIVAAATMSVFSLAPAASAAGFENIVLTSEKDAEEAEEVFATDTPAIYISADLADVETGSTVTVSWVSVDSGRVAPPNYEIDSVNLDIGMIDNHVNSSLSKPNAGWPVGDYRVDLAVDGEVADSVEFAVE